MQRTASTTPSAPATPPTPATATAKAGAKPAKPTKGHWLHPWTGVVILGLDWLLFGSNLLTGMALTPVVIVVGAISGFAGAFWVERRRAHRSIGRALAAGVLAAIVVGAPLPVGGTIVGGLVIALAGLPGRSR